MTDNKSTHILNTSSNLLGFCLIVLTSLKVSKYSEISLIDELTGVSSILLTAASIFSFLSIRTLNEVLSTKYERTADIIFLFALVLIFVITFFIAFTFLIWKICLHNRGLIFCIVILMIRVTFKT